MNIVVLELAALEGRGDLTAMISRLRARLTSDRRLFAQPWVKAWCMRRWRHIFLEEAVKDDRALNAATRIFDKRPPRQRIAERYLHGESRQYWRDEQPEPDDTNIAKTTLVLCPGLLNGLLPEREFRDELSNVEMRFGMRTLRSDSHPARGCLANTQDVLAVLEHGRGRDAFARLIPDDRATPPDEILIIAYSKGAPDTLTTLVQHPELKDRVKVIFTWAGAIGGSQVADDIARKFHTMRLDKSVKVLSPGLKAFAHNFLSADALSRYRIEEYDSLGAVHDLTTQIRQEFLTENAQRIDSLDIPIFNLRGVTSLGEVPWTQRGGYRTLSNFECENDMQVTATCAKLSIPMSTELAVLHGHHWDIACPAFVKRRWFNNTYHPFPKTAAVSATVLLAAELGLIS